MERRHQTLTQQLKHAKDLGFSTDAIVMAVEMRNPDFRKNTFSCKAFDSTDHMMELLLRAKTMLGQGNSEVSDALSISQISQPSPRPTIGSSNPSRPLSSREGLGKDPKTHRRSREFASRYLTIAGTPTSAAKVSRSSSFNNVSIGSSHTGQFPVLEPKQTADNLASLRRIRETCSSERDKLIEEFKRALIVEKERMKELKIENDRKQAIVFDLQERLSMCSSYEYLLRKAYTDQEVAEKALESARQMIEEQQTNLNQLKVHNQRLRSTDTLTELLQRNIELETQVETLRQSNSDWQEQIDRLEGNRQCTICYENYREIVFLPCLHLTCCTRCADNVQTCTVCRKHLCGKVPIQY